MAFFAFVVATSRSWRLCSLTSGCTRVARSERRLFVNQYSMTEGRKASLLRASSPKIARSSESVAVGCLRMSPARRSRGLVAFQDWRVGPRLPMAFSFFGVGCIVITPFGGDGAGGLIVAASGESNQTINLG